MLGSTLKRYQPDRKYICADFETEGLNLFYSRPWQLAYVICDSKNIVESRTEYIFWPDLNISREAMIKTRFNQAEYKANARPPQDVLAELESKLYDQSLDVVGHNFFFDGYIHNTMRRIMGKTPDWSWMNRLVDTLALSRGFRLGIQPDLNNFLSWQYKMISIRNGKLKTRLGQICQDLNIDFNENEAHRADYDVSKNRQLYEALKWKMEF